MGRPVECCGKSTSLAKQIARDADVHGPDTVLVCSFTRAAAANLLDPKYWPGGEVAVPDEQIGTLHSFAFRAAGRAELAETRKRLREFSEAHPQYAVSSAKSAADLEDLGGEFDGQAPGDELLAGYSRLRNLMAERESWPTEVLRFADAWEVTDMPDESYTVRVQSKPPQPPWGERAQSALRRAVGWLQKAFTPLSMPGASCPECATLREENSRLNRESLRNEELIGRLQAQVDQLSGRMGTPLVPLGEVPVDTPVWGTGDEGAVGYAGVTRRILHPPPQATVRQIEMRRERNRAAALARGERMACGLGRAPTNADILRMARTERVPRAAPPESEGGDRLCKS